MKNFSINVNSRDIRPSVGDAVYKKSSNRHSIDLIAEVVDRVGYPCRWFVYDRRGNGYPVEPVGLGSWIAVENPGRNSGDRS